MYQMKVTVCSQIKKNAPQNLKEMYALNNKMEIYIKEIRVFKIEIA